MKCQRTITDKDWTGHRKRKCGRTATKEQPDGLPLCGRHYNQWMKKQAKKNVRLSDEAKKNMMAVTANEIRATQGAKDLKRMSKRLDELGAVMRDDFEVGEKENFGNVISDNC